MGSDCGSDRIWLGQVYQPVNWVAIRVVVCETASSDNPKVLQTGSLADGTGLLRFIIFASSGIEALRLWKSYELDGVNIDEWNGRFSVKLNRSTKIIPIPDLDISSDRFDDPQYHIAPRKAKENKKEPQKSTLETWAIA